MEVWNYLPSQQTGITFNNAITESETINHIYYNQIYSGSGVAIGDLNNDGLPDIYFGGNQVKDKFVFEQRRVKISRYFRKHQKLVESRAGLGELLWLMLMLTDI